MLFLKVCSPKLLIYTGRKRNITDNVQEAVAVSQIMEVNIFIFPLSQFHKIIKSYAPRHLLSSICGSIEKIVSLISLYVGLNSPLEPC